MLSVLTPQVCRSPAVTVFQSVPIWTGTFLSSVVPSPRISSIIPVIPGNDNYLPAISGDNHGRNSNDGNSSEVPHRTERNNCN